MKTAVILCAGLARRMGSSSTPKPLLKIGGRELLSRTVELLRGEGIEEFVFVVNPKNRAPIEGFLSGLSINYRVIVNEHPEKENGYSLFLCKDVVNDEKFILTMGDHLYSEEFVKEAVGGDGLIVDELALYTDKEEATKVLCRNGRVVDIGKKLKNFNGYDTGFFVLDREIFSVAQRLKGRKDKLTMSDIVKEAGVGCTYVSGKFWTDIDTPEDVERARKELIRNSVKGLGDGFISRHLNRKFSLWLSEKLVEKVSPNQVTWAVFFLGLVSALFTLLNPAIGGLLYQLSSMADGIDGEIARASLKTTKFGGWLDSVLDRYVDFLFLSALTLWLKPEISFLPWVLSALFGSLMVSYTTERFKGAYCEDAYGSIPSLRYLPGKRDERVFLIMLFCLFGWIKPLFILISLITNLRVLATTYLIWRERRGT